MANTATRLISLIMLLQRRPSQKADELAEELGVSVRTLHRYMAMLDEIGIPIYSERGPHGGFSLVRGYRMPPLVFTPEEAVAVYLGTSLVEEIWGRLYREAAQGALAKLDNVLPNEQRHEVAWARRTLLATGMHRADYTPLVPLLEKLRRAARERRRVTMSYRGRNQSEPQSRDFEPYALIHRWGWWYVIGHCHLRGAVRTFRVDRIVELTLLAQTFPQVAGYGIVGHGHAARIPVDAAAGVVLHRVPADLGVPARERPVGEPDAVAIIGGDGVPADRGGSTPWAGVNARPVIAGNHVVGHHHVGSTAQVDPAAIVAEDVPTNLHGSDRTDAIVRIVTGCVADYPGSAVVEYPDAGAGTVANRVVGDIG